MENLNYGVIGNCRTAALVSDEGAIEWMCLPKFDSASVFSKILDKEKGGEFGIIPSGAYEIKQAFYSQLDRALAQDINRELMDEIHAFFIESIEK